MPEHGGGSRTRDRLLAMADCVVVLGIGSSDGVGEGDLVKGVRVVRLLHIHRAIAAFSTSRNFSRIPVMLPASCSASVRLTHEQSLSWKEEFLFGQ